MYQIAFRKSQAGGYDLLPSNGDLTAAEVELLEFKNKESRLRHALINVKDDFDFIIIDCPPSLSMLTINSLVSCDGVIVPMQCEYFALEGLSDLIGTISKISQRFNPKTKVGRNSKDNVRSEKHPFQRSSSPVNKAFWKDNVPDRNTT